MTILPDAESDTNGRRWPSTALPVGTDGNATPVTAFATELKTQMTWQYAPRNARILALYEQGKRSQWNASSDVDWSIEVDWGAPLDTSGHARIDFERSPLSRYSGDIWRAFQWEFQSWMISQFLHGEQGALLACVRLAETLPDVETKLYSVNQAADEARHVEVFSRYLTEHVPAPYPVADALQSLLLDILSDSRWDVVTLGMQVILEGVAMGAFQLANSTFHDSLIKHITKLVVRDEARHVSFGTMALKDVYGEMSATERREREEFALDAAELIRRRFLLEEIWQRLEINRSDGVEFARSSPVMVGFRQAIFARVVGTLNRIDLLSNFLVSGFDALNLIGGVGRVAMGQSGRRA
jgi:hypothetical protein